MVSIDNLSTDRRKYEWLVGWLGINGILSTQIAAISCLKKFEIYIYEIKNKNTQGNMQLVNSHDSHLE